MAWSSSSALEAEITGATERRLPDTGIVHGPVGQVVEPSHRRGPTQGDQRHRLLHTRLEAHGVAGRNVEPHAERLRALERERPVGLEEVEVARDLDGAITGVHDLER